jgi:hypothetical protein
MAARSLTIAGVLLDERTMRLDPGFVTDADPTPPPVGGADSANVMVVETLDTSAEVLDVNLLDTASLCLYQSGQPAPRLAAGVIPLHERAQALRFSFHGHVVREVTLPRRAPTVEIRRPVGSRDAVLGTGIHLIEWSTSHPDNAEVSCLPLYYSAGRGWQPLGPPSQASAVPVDFDSLPGGPDCRIRILASDGAHTMIAEADPFPVRIKGFQVVITAPDDGAVVPAGRPVAMAAQVFHWESPDETTDALRWVSSLDGELGSGPQVDRTLSAGDHLITVNIEGAEAESASITLSVQPDPCRPPDEG